MFQSNNQQKTGKYAANKSNRAAEENSGKIEKPNRRISSNSN
jgi:hypothetical protein